MMAIGTPLLGRSCQAWQVSGHRRNGRTYQLFQVSNAPGGGLLQVQKRVDMLKVVLILCLPLHKHE